MSSRLRKFLFLLLAAALLVGTAFVQGSLNRDRERLGLTHMQPLENAPPVLAFTTVALGGFRGLISNMLWMRASDLQETDQYFEAAQLADWITKLEPRFESVWVYQGWNLAYNISVKFKDNADRWRWVERGIELLRDEGLRYNPNSLLIYRELGWFFQHKMGANTDDASLHYKQMWANEMAVVFDKKAPNLDELIDPQTEDQKRRAALLRDKYKMDPRFMKEVNQRWGPLEWRLPEAHAVYWGAYALKVAEENPKKVAPDDIIKCRRLIYQSMLLSFQRGRLEVNPFEKVFQFGPNLDIIPKVNAAYEDNMAEDAGQRDQIARGHRNFLRQAVYFLFVNNRKSEAAQWFNYLGDKYPNQPVLEWVTNSFPKQITLDEYAVACVQADINDYAPYRVQAVIEGLLRQAYSSLVLGEDERTIGFKNLARQAYDNFKTKVPPSREEAQKLGGSLDSFEEIDRKTLERMIDPVNGLVPAARVILRARTGYPPEGTQTSTNAETSRLEIAPRTVPK